MWICKAPANIALIKYMGKHSGNIPCNVSLSYTLSEFTTEVKLAQKNIADEFFSEELSEHEREKFLKHLAYIKKLCNFRGYFSINSKNSFPKSVGIASSASSFAALTMCAFKAISEINGNSMPSVEYMSAVSRVGSGSSCRSFFAPWCIWRGEYATNINIPIDVEHELIFISGRRKEISSSEAHERVKTSLLAQGRFERAEKRCDYLITALTKGEWKSAYQICWEEFFDMHALFETSDPHFGYILPKTLEALIKIREFWEKYNDGPLVTIDAGPNIHLLWRKEGNNKSDLCLRKKFHQLLS